MDRVFIIAFVLNFSSVVSVVFLQFFILGHIFQFWLWKYGQYCLITFSKETEAPVPYLTDKEKEDSEDIWDLNIPYYPRSVSPGAQESKGGRDCRASNWRSQLLGIFCSLSDRAGFSRTQASSLVGNSFLNAMNLSPPHFSSPLNGENMGIKRHNCHLWEPRRLR